MPIAEIRDITPHTRLGLWRMDETPQELKARFPHLAALESPFKHEGRQKEFYSVRALLALMTGDEQLRISYEESGKPLVEGWNISISHTKGFAALILSRIEPVAVDIEQQSARVDNIASRYIRPDEDADTNDRKLTVWSAKETLYKLHSEDDLQFFEMRVTEWHPSHIVIENMKRSQQVTVHHELTPWYVLTYHPTSLPR